MLAAHETMSLYRYLKPISSNEKPATRDGLPNPKGHLSTKIPASAIESANELVRETQSQAACTKQKSRGVYHKLIPDMRARLGRYACENGIAAAARHFSRGTELGKSINESTVRGIKNHTSPS